MSMNLDDYVLSRTSAITENKLVFIEVVVFQCFVLKAARFAQGAKNLSFFGAPVGLFITMDRSLCDSQMMDVGMFIMSILLLARERGLATCPQASWQMWAPTIRELLQLGDGEMIMVGISMGYADTGDAGADIRQPRLPLDEYATFAGFEES